jgi:hypothetical protein
LIEDPVMIGVKPMIWIILNKITSREERLLNIAKEMTGVQSVLWLVNGQAYVQTWNANTMMFKP